MDHPKIIDVSYKKVRQRELPIEEIFKAVGALLCMGVALYGLHHILEGLAGL